MKLRKAFWHALSVALTVGAMLILTEDAAFAGDWD